MVSFGSSSSSQKSSSGGFNKLPTEIKSAFTGLGSDIKSNLLGGAGQSAFTPLAQTADETAAYNAMRQGFAPTATSFANDMAMLQNPYQSLVIDEINRQAGGDFSILKQAMSGAGQLGSNRGILGANDIDLSRQNQIGNFLTNQYNTNAGYILNQIPGLRQQDATNLLGIGNQQRTLDTNTKQANINAILTAAQALGVLPTQEGSSKSTGSSSSINTGIGV